MNKQLFRARFKDTQNNDEYIYNGYTLDQIDRLVKDTQADSTVELISIRERTENPPPSDKKLYRLLVTIIEDDASYKMINFNMVSYDEAMKLVKDKTELGYKFKSLTPAKYG